ncbi:hypothetical protein BC828DRAFT_389277 [Blastocladiella britannica]|nr:hypothetical protein BC828DRAFT_389277 [Blastocladiella britannica]
MQPSTTTTTRSSSSSSSSRGRSGSDGDGGVLSLSDTASTLGADSLDSEEDALYISSTTMAAHLHSSKSVPRRPDPLPLAQNHNHLNQGHKDEEEDHHHHQLVHYNAHPSSSSPPRHMRSPGASSSASSYDPVSPFSWTDREHDHDDDDEDQEHEDQAQMAESMRDFSPLPSPVLSPPSPTAFRTVHRLSSSAQAPVVTDCASFLQEEVLPESSSLLTWGLTRVVSMVADALGAGDSVVAAASSSSPLIYHHNQYHHQHSLDMSIGNADVATSSYREDNDDDDGAFPGLALGTTLQRSRSSHSISAKPAEFFVARAATRPLPLKPMSSSSTSSPVTATATALDASPPFRPSSPPHGGGFLTSLLAPLSSRWDAWLTSTEDDDDNHFSQLSQQSSRASSPGLMQSSMEDDTNAGAAAMHAAFGDLSGGFQLDRADSMDTLGVRLFTRVPTSSSPTTSPMPGVVDRALMLSAF